MRSKRILGMVSAIMMLGVCAVPAYADSEAEIPEYSADKSILTTDTSAPSLSFDMKDWERYIKVTPDGEKISVGASQEKTYLILKKGYSKHTGRNTALFADY